MHKLNNDIYEKATSRFIFLNNKSYIINLNTQQSALLILHTIEDSNVGKNYDIILVCAGVTSSNKGNHFRIISNADLITLNWKSGTSVEIYVGPAIWVQGSIVLI